MAFSFETLFSENVFRVSVGHLVTDATLIAGKELSDAETCCCPLERADIKCFPDCGSQRKAEPSYPSSVWWWKQNVWSLKSSL